MTNPTATSPLDLGRVQLRNRLVSAPMERNYCDTEGHMSEQYIDYLLERARAGVALVFAEATYVRADGKGRTHQLGAHDDSCIAPLARFANALHAEGALVGVELNHGGRTAQQGVSGFPNVAPSPIACEIAGGQVPRELTTQECVDLARSYGEAAARCVRAGIDVLSIHAGHGYLVHQFMSPLYNLRTDAFGDPLRFLDLVIAEVRRAAPAITLGLRFSAVEGSEGGLDADATFDIISRADLAKLDFLDVSAGSYEAGEWIVQSGEWEPGYLRDIAVRYRELGLPYGLAGRINSPEAVRMIVEGGYADWVSLARALHADPRFAAGVLHGEEYRPCIACNVCIDNLGAGQVGCSVNPRVGRGATPLPTPTVRSGATATVVGAGPAGITAAAELAAAGADVTLIDQRPSLGGRMAQAARMRSTPDFHRYLDWAERVLAGAGVETIQGADANNVIATRTPADILIDARGGDGVSDAPGDTFARALDIRAWLDAHGDETPPECTIWGADTVGMVVADTLASRGCRVLLLGSESEIAPDSGRRAKILVVPRLRADENVRVELGVRLVRIEADRVLVVDAAGTSRWLASSGPVLISRGIVDRKDPALSTAGQITASVPAAQSNGISTIKTAVQGGFDAARAAISESVGRHEEALR